LELARDLEDTKDHVLALRAYVRMAGLNGNVAPERRLAMYAAALDSARRVEERQWILARVGDVPTEGSVAFLRPYLHEATLKAEAAAAMINVAAAFIPAQWQLARAPLEEALASDPPEPVRLRAKAVLAELDRYEGYILDWWVAGPYTRVDKRGQDIWHTAFEPEKSLTGSVEWRAQPAATGRLAGWGVDLHATMGGDHRAGYLLTRIESPVAQDARLELGSDDGIKVWLNGELVHENNVLRGLKRGEDVAAVTLRAGSNTLLMKITNDGGSWSACARVRGPDGALLSGIHCAAGERP
jgi:hypothetical protein